MVKANEHYYPLPDELPLDDVCFVVRVPNNQTYIKAFMGQMYRLSKWLAWAKDGTNTATMAAARWRQNMPPRIIDCAIADEIDTRGNMAITINVNCGCGGDTTVIQNTWCLNDDDEIIPTDTLPVGTPTSIDPGTELPPAAFEDWQSFDEYMCKWAHTGAVMSGRAMVAFFGSLGTITKVVEILLILNVAGLGKVLAEKGVSTLFKILQRIVQWKATEFSLDALEDLGTKLQDTESEAFNRIKCVLYTNRHSMIGAKSAFLQSVNDWLVETLYSQQVADFISGLMDDIWPLDVLLDAGWLRDTFLPIDSTVADCSDCTTSEFDGSLIVEWDTVSPVFASLLGSAVLLDLEDGIHNNVMFFTDGPSGNNGGWYIKQGIVRDLIGAAEGDIVTVVKVRYKLESFTGPTTASIRPTVQQIFIDPSLIPTGSQYNWVLDNLAWPMAHDSNAEGIGLTMLGAGSIVCYEVEFWYTIN